MCYSLLVEYLTLKVSTNLSGTAEMPSLSVSREGRKHNKYSVNLRCWKAGVADEKYFENIQITYCVLGECVLMYEYRVNIS